MSNEFQLPDANGYRCGFVAIVGRPNVGKSTLMNHLIGQKISITSKKAQTTRHKITGIYTDDTAQFVFVDTPGFQTNHRNALNDRLNLNVTEAISGVDVIVFVVEAMRFTDADRVVLKDFEGGDLFQACQPAEEVARTGKDAIRFGAMKPVGLTDPRTGRRPWAAIQLRAENKEKTAYNLVGFQTNLTFGEQKRVFHMVPGLENAEFFRYGVMHRNTFVDAPHVLDGTFAVPGTGVRLAGQITGTEGYMEAVATGLLAALNTYAEAIGAAGVELPRVGALGALVGYATDPATVGYQPMHVNFGLVPPLEDGKRRGKRDRYQAYADRALEALDAYLATRPDLFGGDRS